VISKRSKKHSTKIALKNLITGEDEFFTILGPWESDPEHQVISYLSPLGKHLLNHKTGEKLNFTINERKFSYEVRKGGKSGFLGFLVITALLLSLPCQYSDQERLEQ